MEKFEDLLGKTLVKVERKDVSECTGYSIIDNDQIVFHLSTGEKFILGHIQNCCEDVHIESVVGDLDDLVGSPLLLAEEVCNKVQETNSGDEQWTFYKLATIKGYVDIRFYGSSNGGYSTSVDFLKVEV